MSKPNEYVKILLTNNTIESKHPNCIISQWWNTNGSTCLHVCLSKTAKTHTTTGQSSKQLFNVPSVNFNYSFQSRSPLINGFVDQLLIETGLAGMHSVFEIFQTHDRNSVYILLHSTPDIDSKTMWWWVISPFSDFCCFRRVTHCMSPLTSV